MNAQFLAIVNIIVYAGAIMVLFLFVIMLMNLNAQSEPARSLFIKLSGVIAGMSLLIVIVAALSSSTEMQQFTTLGGSDVGLIKVLGKALFKDYLIPFEISSVLFLSAMVGAVLIGKKAPATVNSKL
jgi:NADH-quinone oxidoreductase subunit J